MTNEYILKENFDDELASVIIPKRGIFSFFDNINRTPKYTFLFALAGIVLGAIAIAAVFFTGGLAAIGIAYAVAIALGAGLLGAILGFVVAKASKAGPLTYESGSKGENNNPAKGTHTFLQCEEAPDLPYSALHTPRSRVDVDKSEDSSPRPSL